MDNVNDREKQANELWRLAKLKEEAARLKKDVAESEYSTDQKKVIKLKEEAGELLTGAIALFQEANKMYKLIQT